MNRVWVYYGGILSLLALFCWLHAPQVSTWTSNLVLFLKGCQAYQETAYGDAEVYFREAQLTNSYPRLAAYNLGNALYQQTRYAEAIPYYQRALLGDEKEGHKSFVWANLGNAFYQTGNLAQSYGCYKQALLTSADDAAIREDFLFVQRKYEESLRLKSPEESKNSNPFSSRNPAKAERKSQEQGTPPASDQHEAAKAQGMSAADIQNIFNALSHDEKEQIDALTKIRRKSRKPITEIKDY